MSEPAREMDVEDARRPVRGRLTIDGERVTTIFPAATIEALRFFADLLTDERRSVSLPAMIRRAMPWSASLSDDQIRTFVSQLAVAAASGTDAPELVAAAMLGWRDTAEISANPEEAARLRQALGQAREGKAKPWRYDDALT